MKNELTDRKQELVDDVILSVQKDLEYNDATVLEELLSHIPVEILIHSLPEESWSKFNDLTKYPKVKKIKNTIHKFGSLNFKDLDIEAILFSEETVGHLIQQVFIIGLDTDGVEIDTFFDGEPVGEDIKEYEELSEDLLDIVYDIVINYETDCEKNNEK